MTSLDFESELGPADNGDFEHDLQELMESAGTDLPQLRGRMGDAKSYAERLFEFPDIGPLSIDSAAQAIIKPIRAEGAEITPGAVDRILADTRCYPYFLQEWGQRSWEEAVEAPISTEDVERATTTAVAALDESFFRVRFDRLTPQEKRYLRAMAELGTGPHRSGAIAECLKREVSSQGPVRSSLISKGMIWSPSLRRCPVGCQRPGNTRWHTLDDELRGITSVVASMRAIAA